MELQHILLKQFVDGDLSEYHINILLKHNINTPQHLVKTEINKLCTLLALKPEKIYHMKIEILKQLGTTPTTLRTLYQKNSEIQLIYKTGINDLDRLLRSIGQPFQSGRIWELCGLVDVGKTELLYTFAVNFVCQYKNNAEVLFIDTKNGFSSKRILGILRERKLEKKAIDSAMLRFKQVQANSPESIIEILESLYSNLKTFNEALSYIKIIFIDSLPACWMHLRANNERMDARFLIAKLAAIVQRISTKYHIAFIIENLSFAVQDEIENEDENLYWDDYCVYSQPQNTSQAEYDFSILGRYWSTVSSLRLAINLSQSFSNEDDGSRVIKVLKNNYGPTGDNCPVCITGSGVV